MFKVGELIKRKLLKVHPRAICVVVDNTGDNYTFYNNSTQKIQTVACVVINSLYSKYIA
jgi:hypothetical protein